MNLSGKLLLCILSVILFFSSSQSIFGSSSDYDLLTSIAFYGKPLDTQMQANSIHKYKNLFKAEKEAQLWGYIDEKGEWIIEARYDDASDFSNGLAIVNQNGISTVIDEEGKNLFSSSETMSFSRYRNFSEGLLVASTLSTISNRFGYVGMNGRWIIKPMYEEAGDFSEGVSCVRYNNKYGYVNHQGKWVIEPKFEDASNFSGGLAKVKINDKYGYINLLGEWEIEPYFDSANAFISGYASVEIDKKWGVINNNGEWIIDPKYGPIYLSENGIAHGILTAEIRYKEQFTSGGFYPSVMMDFDENLVSTTLFNRGLRFFEDSAVAWSGEYNKYGKPLYGYIDFSGEWVIPPQFTSARDFKNGLAAVDISVSPPHDSTNAFGYDTQRGFINKKGEWVQYYRIN